MLVDLYPGLHKKPLLNALVDNPLADPLCPLGVDKEVLIRDEHDSRAHLPDLLHHGIDGSDRVVALLAERIKIERTEFAVVRAASGCEDDVELFTAQRKARHIHMVRLATDLPVGKLIRVDFRQGPIGIVDDLAVLGGKKMPGI